MNYPGHIVKIGEKNNEIVTAIIKTLANAGLRSNGPVGVFDKNLAATVMLFQSQHADAAGRPLKVDGQIGPLTWASLFANATPAAVPAAAGISPAALAFAVTQIGVREKPLGSNRGPEVDEYLKSTGTPIGSFWCMAFVYFCYREGASKTGLANPFPRTAGCLDAWNRSPASKRINRVAAIADPSLVRPGMVFIHDYGGGMGHTGFVVRTAAARSLRSKAIPIRRAVATASKCSRSTAVASWTKR
jgi:CHAP domain